MTWTDYVRAITKKCYYLSTPHSDDTVSSCIANWSMNINCRDQVLRMMLQRCPDLKRLADTYAPPLSAHSFITRKPKSREEHFVDDYCHIAYNAMNQARGNLTRGIKRVFFSGATSGPNPKDESLSIFGTYQLTMGSLAGDTHREVRKTRPTIYAPCFRCDARVRFFCLFVLKGNHQPGVGPRPHHG